MNEQLQLQLVSIIESIRGAVGASATFAIEQLPDIAQHYVLYGRAVSVAQTSILLLLAFSLLYFARWAYKNPWNQLGLPFDSTKKRSDSYYGAISISLILGTVLFLVAVLDFNYLVWFAPKVWLILELARLIK